MESEFGDELLLEAVLRSRLTAIFQRTALEHMKIIILGFMVSKRIHSSIITYHSFKYGINWYHSNRP